MHFGLTVHLFGVMTRSMATRKSKISDARKVMEPEEPIPPTVQAPSNEAGDFSQASAPKQSETIKKRPAVRSRRKSATEPVVIEGVPANVPRLAFEDVDPGLEVGDLDAERAVEEATARRVEGEREDDGELVDWVDNPQGKVPDIEINSSRLRVMNQTDVAHEATPEQRRKALKQKVRFFYDLQRLRMQMAIRANRQSVGSEIQMHEGDKSVLLVRGMDMKRAEKLALRDIADHLRTIPFYRDVLSDKTRYKGIGPTLAGVLLGEFDITREKNPSQMWAFAGLHVVPCKCCVHCGSALSEVKSINSTSKSGASIYSFSRAVVFGIAQDTNVEPAVLDFSSLSVIGNCENPSANSEKGLVFTDAVVTGQIVDREDSFEIRFSRVTIRGRVQQIGGLDVSYRHIDVDCPGGFKKGDQPSPSDIRDGHRSPRPEAGQKLSYNKFLKMKLLGVMAGTLLKCASPWRKFYDNYKARWVSQGKGATDMHRHKAACRYMIKKLLINLYEDWRQYEGLSTVAPYADVYIEGHQDYERLMPPLEEFLRSKGIPLPHPLTVEPQRLPLAPRSTMSTGTARTIVKLAPRAANAPRGEQRPLPAKRAALGSGRA